MWQSLHDAWWRLAMQNNSRSFLDVLACRVLDAATLVYRAAVSIRNTAYDAGWVKQVRLPARVVSVGNLTVGGTGKTACVELVARKLLAANCRIAILSRGYGGSRRDYSLQWLDNRLQVDGQPHANGFHLADEAQLLARRLSPLPVVVGAKRAQTGRRACNQFGVDTIILDDGFQHRKLARDCEIVLLNARMPFSGWPMLPRGPMREPIESLKRADVIILTKADESLQKLGAYTERLRSLNAQAVLVTTVHEPHKIIDGKTGHEHPPIYIQGKKVGLLSSIGDPEGFEATLASLDANVQWHQSFPDHHPYRKKDWQAVSDRCAKGELDAIITTEKDWVRLRPIVVNSEPPVPVLILTIRMKIINGEEALDARLNRLCNR